MRSRILYPLIVLVFLSLSAYDFSSDYFGLITIHASKYDLKSSIKIPQRIDSFKLVLYKMCNSELQDDLISSKEVHSIENGSFHFVPDTGRYIVYVSQDSLSDAIDFHYMGGNISLTLILK